MGSPRSNDGDLIGLTNHVFYKSFGVTIIGDTIHAVPSPPAHTDGAAVHVAFLLGKAGQRALRLLEEALRPLELRPREFGVLAEIGASSATSQQRVADVLGVDRSDMVATMEGLEARRLVTRRRNPADRRAYVVSLTPAGTTLLARAHAAVVQAEAQLLGSVDAGALRASLLLLLD